MTSSKKTGQDREKRLAKALKANLARRKTHIKSRAEGASKSEAGLHDQRETVIRVGKDN